MAFENPCDKCDREDTSICTVFQRCNDYRYWLNYNFKVARHMARKRKEELPKTTCWVYQHPDDARRYIEKGVCGECKLASDCDDPCNAYMEWYNKRMEYFRAIADIEGNT